MKKILSPFFRFLLCSSILVSCAVTSHNTRSVQLGKPFAPQNLKPEAKGTITFQKFVAADWATERGGLINLKDPKAVGLQPGPEAIQIYFYVIDHPKFGRYLIDTGISKVFRKDPKEWPISSIVASAMNTSALKIQLTAEEWLKKDSKKVEGIFLTHMHLDHVLGTADFPAGTTLFIGPKESTGKRFLNLFVQGTTDAVLGENPNLSELTFSESASTDSGFPPALDFFGDESLLVFHVEGHTRGSLAFLVRTNSGTQLVVGDTCHTSWGWENGVSPGDFTEDQERNQRSLDFLKNLAGRFKTIGIHPGHQSISK
ncbi:MBL fold metallo-hydrolase [Leptospira gomenensis]|uniref:MBL fold metallo-hydrolase n=1 Tax=Leptospira gomenensis TaxID=2484974 RepID=A0A5F1YBZ6_9LEPT|nr:MBL fold metallo-hydrolase [Leptospira gomenensis]TGK34939.1 MBL fold metallo-hydrolase [Leptospira gomenensis]TGK36735.1 MBL fold metallo-hydrolase [Leptospira gomenensis]TGK48860.1 MBL fold metallo-hydrolase [Leptospira gomenensis]TGK64626.1 MBL fold metallo-hydrolase [Leptospira gomenensis]